MRRQRAGPRERGLEADERRSCQAAPRSRAASAGPDAQIARARDRDAGRQRAHRRAREREDDAGNERREPDADFRGPRHAGRGRRADEKVAGPERQGKAGARRDETQDEILRHDLPNDPRLAGAEREPRGELVLPLERSADEQPRGVSTRDEQERGNSGGERVQRWPDIAGQLLEQPGNGDTCASVGVWVLDASVLARTVSSARACSTAMPGRMRPSTRSIRASRRPTLGSRPIWDPYVRHPRPHRRRMKPLGKNADERVGPAAEDDGLPEHRGIALVTPHPERVADDRDRRRAGPILAGRNPRPRTGWTPNTSKMPELARAPLTRSACSPPVSVNPGG